MLYDHQKDPQENVNVSGNTAYKDVVKEMRKLLEERISIAESAKVKDDTLQVAALPPGGTDLIEHPLREWKVDVGRPRVKSYL